MDTRPSLPSHATRQRLWRAASQTVPGTAAGFLATGREPSLKRHFRLVRPEFAGQPRLCWICARCIILIRREIDLDNQWAILRWLLDTPEHRSVLLARLNTRWLVAICDTFADHGGLGERSAALCLSTLINTIKLCETERLILNDAGQNGAALARFSDELPRGLWDGVTSYLIPGGDMPRNLFHRLRTVLADHPPLDAIGCTLMERLKTGRTILSRLSRLNPRFWE